MRARAMALGSLSQHRNETKVADFCSAPVDGSYAAVDKRAVSPSNGQFGAAEAVDQTFPSLTLPISGSSVRCRAMGS